MRILTIVALGLSLGACNGTATSHTSSSEGIACVDPRPQVCTMEYNPVCAVLGDSSNKQYSSPCNACADDAVKSYLPGACLTDK
jgi:hypothetical protein